MEFGLRSDAARLSANRDKALALAIYEDCERRYSEAVAVKRRKFLGIF